MDSKPSNPKDLIGSDKLPLHLWPETATILGSLGLLDGALKYGRSNFRAIGVRASIYYDACRRHLNKWFEGEELDPDSGLPHLAHALACLAIIIDAEAAGKLNDDRQYPGGYAEYVAKMTPHVKRLKAKYQQTPEPVHYTHVHSSDEFQTAAKSVAKLKDDIMQKWRQQQNTSRLIYMHPCEECKGYTGNSDGSCDKSCNDNYWGI